MSMNHPDILRTEATGYPEPEPPVKTGWLHLTVIVDVPIEPEDEIRTDEHIHNKAIELSNEMGRAVKGDSQLICHVLEED